MSRLSSLFRSSTSTSSDITEPASPTRTTTSDHFERSASQDLARFRMSEEHERIFTVFKENLAKAGLYTPPTETSSASADDVTLGRFLRARKYDPLKAQKQWANTVAWRKEKQVEKLYATFDPVEFEAAKHFYPRWTGRRDKHGVPVYVFKLSALTGSTFKQITAVPEQRRYERIVALWEFMSRFTHPLCTALPHEGGEPICSVNSIIDLEGVSLSTMWTLRHHLQQASELATAHYPETLNTIAVVNAPSFFPTVWGWIKAWFDEGTRNKVHVLGKDPGPTLTKLIDPANLPKAYGGELDFEFDDDPNLDEDTKKLIGEVPKGPIIFVDGKAVKPTVPEDSTAVATSPAESTPAAAETNGS